MFGYGSSLIFYSFITLSKTDLRSWPSVHICVSLVYHEAIQKQKTEIEDRENKKRTKLTVLRRCKNYWGGGYFIIVGEEVMAVSYSSL